jgi:[protein-PII] uridylyltransferase
LCYYSNKKVGLPLLELKAKIEELIHTNTPDFEIAKLIKEELNNYYKTLPEIFKNSGGKDFLVKHTRKLDSIIKLIYRIATREMFFEYFPTKNAIPLTILALGSYGREQLSPKSDIDIAFIYKDIPAYNTEAIIEKMLYLMWDSGLKLGHRVHEINSLQEVANSDITIKTALLESRFVDGSKFLWTQIGNQINYIRKENQKEFILAKIQERRELRAKYPLMMEPNLKEGVGGFRDANLVYWLGKMLYNTPRILDLPSSIVKEKDYIKFRISLEFLFRVRVALHLSVNKKTDQLRLEHIPQVSALLGYKNTPNAHLLFAKKVNKSLRVIWLYSRIWIDALSSDTIAIYVNYLKPTKDLKYANEIIKFLIDNAKEPFSSHPKLNQSLLHAKNRGETRGRYKLVKQIFKAKYTSSILIALSEAGKLGTYIAPIKKIEALPQFDGYHKYPVDTHLIRSLEALETIKEPHLKKIYNSLTKSKQLLIKLVVFLHDAGKGRNRDHHQLGAYLFKIYAQKLQLPQEDLKLGFKLILHHNKLSQIAQKEDIYSQKSVAKLAAIFPSKLELDLIYLLTYADTNGVGSEIYNNFSARLFETLHKHALEFLQHSNFLGEMSKRVKRVAKIEASKEFKVLPNTLKRKILSIESNLPFIKYSTTRIIEITKRATDINNYAYEITNDKFLTIEIIKKDTLDLGYLLAKLSNLNLVNIDIIKLFSGKKYFKIDFNQKVEQDDITQIGIIIDKAFNNPKELNISKPFIKKEEIKIDCNHTNDYALIHLHTLDQKGLLAYLMIIFEKLNIEIVSSKTYTHKKYVDDIFLIEKNGNFCTNLEYLYSSLVTSKK